MKSTFGLLDVTVGRRELEKRLLAGEQIEVVIYGTLDNSPQSWNDDGTSTEFTVAVDRFTINDRRGTYQSGYDTGFADGATAAIASRRKPHD